jgi:CRISP-associated protein Cas1
MTKTHLYISQSGVTLSLRDDCFVLQPKVGEARVVPMRAVEVLFVPKGTQMLSDVLFAALQHDIDVQWVDRRGAPQGRLWSNKFGSISMVRKQQLAFAAHPDATAWVRDVLKEKIGNQVAALYSLAMHAEEGLIQEAVQKMSDAILKLDHTDVTVAVHEASVRLRSLEAHASRTYFQMLSKLLPPAYHSTARSQHPALDMFNGMLNYAYGMLYGKVETALLKAGIDPYIGIFHRDEYNRPVLVYDVIERYRAWADYTVCSLCKQEVMFLEFFEVEQGAFYLNPFGKRLLIQAFEDYLSEVINWRGLDRSRAQHIELDAFRFATSLKEWKGGDTSMDTDV